MYFNTIDEGKVERTSKKISSMLHRLYIWGIEGFILFLYNIALQCIPMHYIALQCIIMYTNALQCITMHYNV